MTKSKKIYEKCDCDYCKGLKLFPDIKDRHYSNLCFGKKDEK